MKILMLNYEFLPLGGGTGIANYYLLKEFSRFPNLKVDLVTSSANHYQEEKVASNIRVFKLNIGKNNRQLHHQTSLNLFNYFLLSTVWTLKHKSHYDLIHAFSGLPGAVTAWLSGLPYLVSLRGAEEPGYEPRFDFWLKLIKPFLAIIYTRAKSLDANSNYLKHLALKSFPQLKIKVISNGVDGKIFYPARRRAKRPLILSTNRFGQRKGVCYLIKAMPTVLAVIPKARLILLGQGVEEKELKRLADKLRVKQQVKFIGQVAHEQISSWYRQARVFVNPSLSESQSNSLLEALACGLPVVATNIGGNPELVKAKNGLLVPAANSQALAQAMIKALNQSWPKVQLAKKFSWAKTAKQYFRLYSRQFSLCRGAA